MAGNDVLILSGDDVRVLLDGREQEILAAAAAAYKAHGRGHSSLPHSLFLRFPADERNRIIALPAYLGDGFAIAGMKWISSFPANLEKGFDRASAVIILNSAQTGRPQAIMEGSLISAKRTAASAALAASHLTARQPRAVGIIGCGPINFEVTRFLLAVWPELRSFYVFDIDAGRAEQFREKCRQWNVEVEVVPELTTAVHEAEVISFATTAGTPHVFGLSQCIPVSGGLSPEKLELLMHRLEQKVAPSFPSQVIPRRTIRSPRAPLAYAQERMWVLYQLDPSSSAFKISLAVRLEGKLDIATLKRALGALIRPHEVLRTTERSTSGVRSTRMDQHRTLRCDATRRVAGCWR